MVIRQILLWLFDKCSYGAWANVPMGQIGQMPSRTWANVLVVKG